MEKFLAMDPKILIIQMLGFALLFLTLKLFLFKPIRNILDQRKQEVQDDYNSADAAKSDAAALKADYELRLSAVEDEIRSKLADAVKESQKVREELMAESRAQADKILTKAQEEIQRERASVMIELKNTVVNLTIEATSKLIEEKLDKTKHEELITKFIDNLDGVSK